MTKQKLMRYPQHDDVISGCKVEWRVYATRQSAGIAAEAARYNAEILERQGYDWGYQSPGQIVEMPDGRFKVTIP